jgi:DNA-binding MurR/RpiR family transcriptional regulator
VTDGGRILAIARSEEERVVEPQVSLPATVAVRSVLPSLAPAEARVARAVLEDPAAVARMSITALATRCGTSEATVVRFSRNVGFDGYPALRIALAAEGGRSAAEGRSSVGLDVEPDDSLAQVVEKVGAADSRAIVDTVANLDIDALARSIDAIRAARRIEIHGIGASGLAATDLEQKMRRIGLLAAAATDRHAALTSAALLAPEDVVITLSHSGETSDVIEPLEQAAAVDATRIAITNFPRSSLARVADIVLTTAVHESVYRSGAIASRVAQLTVVDCLFVGVARQDHDGTLAALDRTYLAVRATRRDGRSGGSS